MYSVKWTKYRSTLFWQVLFKWNAWQIQWLFNKQGEFCPKSWEEEGLFTVTPLLRKSIVMTLFMSQNTISMTFFNDRGARIHLPRPCILDRALIQSIRQSGLFSDWLVFKLAWSSLIRLPKAAPLWKNSGSHCFSLRPIELLPVII